jgi:1-acyl-sn-glycerol-3-phosphate acyltransferase
VILFLWGIRVEVHNRKAIQWNQTYIFVSNHASYLDILCLLKVIPNFTGFLAKAELSDIPLFGIFFKTIDIEVHRGKGEMSAASYRKAVKALQSHKSLVIFPEGGIFPDPTKVKPFKEGAFQMAIRNKIPVVPISLPDNYKILPDQDERKAAKPGKIRVILYEPLDTGNMTEADLPQICTKVHDLIQGDINKYADK